MTVFAYGFPKGYKITKNFNPIRPVTLQGHF